MSPGRTEGEIAYMRYILRTLFGAVCRCGEPKGHGIPFCDACHARVPLVLRGDLALHIGHGYEEAYEAACRYLDDMGGRPAKVPPPRGSGGE